MQCFNFVSLSFFTLIGKCLTSWVYFLRAMKVNIITQKHANFEKVNFKKSYFIWSINYIREILNFHYYIIKSFLTDSLYKTIY